MIYSSLARVNLSAPNAMGCVPDVACLLPPYAQAKVPAYTADNHHRNHRHHFPWSPILIAFSIRAHAFPDKVVVTFFTREILEPNVNRENCVYANRDVNRITTSEKCELSRYREKLILRRRGNFFFGAFVTRANLHLGTAFQGSFWSWNYENYTKEKGGFHVAKFSWKTTNFLHFEMHYSFVIPWIIEKQFPRRDHLNYPFTQNEQCRWLKFVKLFVRDDFSAWL